MTAYNVVRFRVKPGREQDFIDAHKIADPGFDGMRKFALIDTGGGTYCVVGEWESFDHLIDARPGMIGMLDTIRDMLEDMGSGIGVTDPVSGAVVHEIAPKPKRKAKAKKKAAPKAKPKAKAKAKAKKPAKKATKKKTAKRRKR
jgi:hypothetical protein